jgi:hypothetical protein
MRMRGRIVEARMKRGGMCWRVGHHVCMSSRVYMFTSALRCVALCSCKHDRCVYLESPCSWFIQVHLFHVSAEKLYSRESHDERRWIGVCIYQQRPVKKHKKNKKRGTYTHLAARRAMQSAMICYAIMPGERGEKKRACRQCNATRSRNVFRRVV